MIPSKYININEIIKNEKAIGAVGKEKNFRFFYFFIILCLKFYPPKLIWIKKNSRYLFVKSHSLSANLYAKEKGLVQSINYHIIDEQSFWIDYIIRYYYIIINKKIKKYIKIIK